MRKLIYAVAVGLLIMSFTLSAPASKPADAASYVYICTGSSSRRFHSFYDCSGLSGCKGDIVRTTKSEAIENGKSPCRICYD